MLAKRCGHVQHAVEPVRHAVRAHVADHELASEAQTFAQGGVARCGHEAIQIDAILDDFDFLRRHAPLAQARAKGIGDHHDTVGSAIEVLLDQGQAAHDGMSRGQCAYGHDRLGPQIAHLEDERKRTCARDGVPGDGAEKLWAGGD